MFAYAKVHVQELARNTEARENRCERKVPVEKAMHMKRTFELPTLSEGFVEV